MHAHMFESISRGVVVALAACLIPFNTLPAQTPAFPGAEGFGKWTTGGRGGRVVEVTNLNGDRSPGSFRAALATPGTDPITIMFRVSGIISFDTVVVKVPRSNLTIAGQTAPGDGICLRKGRIYFSGSNLIIRYLRFRIGDEFKTSIAALDVENTRNVIIDHCSMSWSVEENHTCYDNKWTTVQWCILSEGLYQSYNSKGARSYGSQWGGQYASYHHNLFAHNASRSPRVNGARAHDTTALCDYRNNVIYNWGSSSAIYGGEVEIRDTLNPGKARANINWVSNYYKPGPATPSTKKFLQAYYESSTGAGKAYGKWFISGNVMEGISGGMNTDNWLGVDVSKVGSAANIKSDTLFEVAAVTTETPEQALQSVLAGAGATLPTRDAVDRRIIKEIRGEAALIGTGVFGVSKGIIDSQGVVGGWPAYQSIPPPPDTDHDGMPDSWETTMGLNPADSSDGAVIAGDGYSNLEHYLNSIAVTVAADSNPSLSLPRSTRLLQNFPNPFNPTTAISYDLPAPRAPVGQAGLLANSSSLTAQGSVRLSIFDLLGREVAVLVNEQKGPGSYTVEWNAARQQSGVYFIRLMTGSSAFTEKMILQK